MPDFLLVKPVFQPKTFCSSILSWCDLALGLGMQTSLPSRAWSCHTLQRGLGFARDMSMELASFGEPELEAMERELALLQAGGMFKTKVVRRLWFVLKKYDCKEPTPKIIQYYMVEKGPKFWNIWGKKKGGKGPLPPPYFLGSYICILGPAEWVPEPKRKTIIQKQWDSFCMFWKTLSKPFLQTVSQSTTCSEAEEAAEKAANGLAGHDAGKEGKGLEGGPLVGISKFLWYIPPKVSTITSHGF